MKYINKIDDKKSVWVLTESMAETLKNAGIGFGDMDQLPKYLGKLFANEIASIYKLQDTIAAKLGVVRSSITFDGVDKVNESLLTAAFNNVSSEELIDFITKHNKYYVHGTRNGFVICVTSRTSTNPMSGWDVLTSDTLPSALLEAIYMKVGYLESHFKEVTKSSIDGFTLADVYKLLTTAQLV